jgi:hydroxymethylpyrimidine/phosphomethylpyrimidine kinase
LAQKRTVIESVAVAKDFVTAAIRGSLAIGKGHGPANPMAWMDQKERLAGGFKNERKE